MNRLRLNYSRFASLIIVCNTWVVCFCTSLAHATPIENSDFTFEWTQKQTELSEALHDLSPPSPKCDRPQTESQCPIPKDPDSKMACTRFIRNDCTLGPIGLRIQELFKTHYTPRTLAGKNIPEKDLPILGNFVNHPPEDIDSICPHYRESFTQSVKEKFWISFLMNLSFDESGCDGKQTQTPNTVGDVGAFQLETKKSENRYRPLECTDPFIHAERKKQEELRNLLKADRSGARSFLNPPTPTGPPPPLLPPEAPTPSHGPIPLQELDANLHCAIAMLAVQLAKPGTLEGEKDPNLSLGLLFSPHSYWNHLKRNPFHRTRGKTSPLYRETTRPTLLERIMSFPGCR